MSLRSYWVILVIKVDQNCYNTVQILDIYITVIFVHQCSETADILLWGLYDLCDFVSYTDI